VRVLYLSASGELGGGERSLLDMVASVRRAQPSWSIHVLSASEGPLSARAAALGAGSSVLPFPPALARVGEAGTSQRSAGGMYLVAQLVRSSSGAAIYGTRLRHAIRAFRPDVIHTNSLKMHVLGAWASPEIPVVWHLHDYVGARPMTARLLRWSIHKGGAIIANSQSVADDARSVFGSRLPIVPILNGVDLDRFSPAGPAVDLDALAGVPPPAPDAVRVGLVATFARWKGHVTFLEALAQLADVTPLHAYVVGGALYQTAGSQYSADELRRLAADRGLTRRVGFTGFIAEPASAMRALDIVVHASTAPEPFGLVIAEAMACGRAVIAADAGGARELFTPGVDAVAHTPGDVSSLAARILELASDAGLRHRLGRAARLTAERRFDRDRLAADLLPLYERAVAA
jgi:glycosyltransferase involved in cell wall biosynthesis